MGDREPSLDVMESLAGLLTDSTRRASGGPVIRVEAGYNFPEPTFSVVLDEGTQKGPERWHYEFNDAGVLVQEPVLLRCPDAMARATLGTG